MTIAQTIGQNLKNARKEKGLTQEEISCRLGILQPAYARYESGKVQLNYEMVQKVCELLDITPDVLWGYSD